jgi:hypothetical protein
VFSCDFCHVNHQPCDNGEPRCSVCEKHNKSCQYNRPQKKRGPAKGYRSTLNSLNESAAAWGAALNLIPTLGPVIESYLKTAEGSRLIRAIKDPKQQDFFIRSWQESGVFRTFFGGEGPDEDEAMGMQAMGPIGFPQLQHADMRMIPPPPTDQRPLPQPPPPAQRSPALTTASSHSFPEPGQFNLGAVMHPSAPRLSTSVSDIVARDAARQCVVMVKTCCLNSRGADQRTGPRILWRQCFPWDSDLTSHWMQCRQFQPRLAIWQLYRRKIAASNMATSKSRVCIITSSLVVNSPSSRRMGEAASLKLERG